MPNAIVPAPNTIKEIPTISWELNDELRMDKIPPKMIPIEEIMINTAGTFFIFSLLINIRSFH